jgi:hypothetical protein
MRRIAVAGVMLVLCALAVVLILVRPSLLLIVLGGIATGAGVAVVIALLGRAHATSLESLPIARERSSAEGRPRVLTARQPPTARNESAARRPLRIVVAVVVAVLVGFLGFVLLGGSDDESSLAPVQRPPYLSPLRTELGPGVRPEPQVRSVRYEGTFKMDEPDNRWSAVEVLAVSSKALEEAIEWALSPVNPLAFKKGSGPTVLTAEPSPQGLLGPDWTYNGPGGEAGEALVYVRHRSIPFHMSSFWPPRGEDRIKIGDVHLRGFPVTLVPADGSRAKIVAPDGVVRSVDFPSSTSSYGGEESVSVELEGMEHDPNGGELRVTVANGIGRSAPYDALASISASSVIKVFFGLFFATVGGFIGNRLLKKWFPERGSGAAGGGAPA